MMVDAHRTQPTQVRQQVRISGILINGFEGCAANYFDNILRNLLAFLVSLAARGGALAFAPTGTALPGGSFRATLEDEPPIIIKALRWRTRTTQSHDDDKK
jgi:hypothetical protein